MNNNSWEWKTLEVEAIDFNSRSVMVENAWLRVTGKGADMLKTIKKGKVRAGIDANGLINWIKNADEIQKKPNSIAVPAVPSKAKEVLDTIRNKGADMSVQGLIVKQNVLNRATDLVISNLVPVKANNTALSTIKDLTKELYEFVTGEKWN